MYSISILHTLQMLIRQHGAKCEHFHGFMNDREAMAWSGSFAENLRAYTLRGDPMRKIWLNGDHVASVVRW